LCFLDPSETPGRHLDTVGRAARSGFIMPNCLITA
jgi:hypothetical protein